MSTYRVAEWQGNQAVRELGCVDARVPKQALYLLAPGFTNWSYRDNPGGWRRN